MFVFTSRLRSLGYIGIGALTLMLGQSVAGQPAAPPAATTPKGAPAKLPAIKLDLAPGADVGQAWENFFAQHEPEKDPAKLKAMSPEDLKKYRARLVKQQQAVLETVQQLKEAVAEALKHDKKDEATKKHEEIIALIEAALRHDQAQPWMYEILALSMKEAGQPQEEIDRAIMSAAEFTQNSADLMYLGAYLVQVNMDRRALQIFHQVAQTEPLWPEPYYQGMLAARRLQDLPGLEWSTAGILGQAWPQEQAKIWDDAYRAAEAALKDLRDHKRNEEADHYQAILDQAVQRDCLVAVQWTGDADIDVMVKEPAGTVCSLRNQRTTSGGMLVGDLTTENNASIHGHVAVYSCPKAFSGNYQLLIRRVFGKLTTGSVKVTLITHFHTKKALTKVLTVPLGSSESLVKFEVADGRRNQSIQEQQVINAAVAAVAQTNVTRQILAQQLAAANDPQAAAALGAVQQAAAGASAVNSQQINPLAFPGFWPNGLQSAVGYQPIIITLPEGTNLMATGVVSADRRYVRITTVPLFSAVTDVHTFSMASGQTASTPGVGTGGAGYSGFGGQGQGGNGALGGQGGAQGGGLGGGGLGGGGLGGGGLGGGGMGGGGLF